MMKRLTLIVAGISMALVLGSATQATAKFSESLYVQSTNSIVFEEQKCKEGEKWDEEAKKCVADEGKK